LEIIRINPRNPRLDFFLGCNLLFQSAPNSAGREQRLQTPSLKRSLASFHIIVVYTTMIQADLSSLPLCLNRGTAFVIFAVAIFIVAAHTAIAAMATPRTSLSPRTKSTIPFIIAAFLASWLALAIIVGDGANFPIALESRRSASGLVALIPFIVAVIALFASKSLRAINAATPSAWLIAIQTYRVAGIMFLFPFVTYGLLPQ
jgi:hypothetical protein